MFLTSLALPNSNMEVKNDRVAIPSNRVNVSYTVNLELNNLLAISRNPLKSGQCFLQGLI